MAIDELNKPMGQWCPHRTGSTGCSIYGAHPQSCKDFACQWLFDPAIPDELRPDRVKVVLTGDPEGRLIANCDPSTPVAWQREPIYTLLRDQAAATWTSNFSVWAKAGNRLWFITPTSPVDLGQVAPTAKFDIKKFRDGRAKVEVLAAYVHRPS